MTSRLKKKLDIMGVDVQSNSQRMTENFCLIGTPLPPLEKSKDTGEFVPLWKQEVRDEQGRRRLHGAFTGGFSAGYYNTVGSKEGWVPSTFSSSRSERAKKKQAKPEDFMDDEDLAEARESKKLVDTTEETDIFGGTQAELARRGRVESEKDSIASTLESLLPPAKDSVGARLLKKMGWRLGQGIGPRITYKQLRAQEGRPIEQDEIVDEEANKHLYAPRDTKTIMFHKKENSFGLGYVPGKGLTDIAQGQNGKPAQSGPTLSAGFGLGALNEAEDDDIDVYDHGASGEHRHMAYDVGENEDNDRITLGGNKPSGFDRKSGKSAFTFHDGRPIVSGFVLFEKPLIEDRWFPIPDIPKGWSPDPRRVWATDTSNKENESAKHPQILPSALQNRRAWMKGKTADERGSMLGETPLPGAPRSVFDYLSQKDRDRLKNLSSSLASETILPQQPPLPLSVDIPRIDSRTAQAALKGFQPFTTDPAKQARYTVYLQSQASPDAPEIKPIPNQSNENFNKELADYAKAAQIFKPVSGAMAGRFASASTVEILGGTHQGLHKPTKDDYARLEGHQVEDEAKEEETPKAHAAKMGMFGPLTREAKVWQPARLLCRRFGVKDPYPDGVPGEEPVATPLAKSDAWKAEIMKSAPNLTAPSSSATASGTTTPPSTRQLGQRDLANIGMGDDEEQGKETLTYERPTKDIFKAIFASDEEDSDEEDDQMNEPEKEIDTSTGGGINITPPQEALIAKGYQTPTSQGHITGKVDLTSFRPTFVPKPEREERKNVKDKDEKDKKDKDKKKKGKMVVSFDLEEENEIRVKTIMEKRDHPRKRQKEKSRPSADNDSIWVEKPPPEVVKDLVIPISTEPMEVDDSPHPRGRKRAIDFL